jgi:hypothetical protein
MNKTEFTENIISKCGLFLNDIGFKFKKNTLGAIIFEKRTNKSIYSIGCYHSKYGATFINRSIGAGITFLEIESIFAPVVVKHKLVGSSLKADTNSTIGINQIPGFENKDYTKYNEDLKIIDEIDVDILVGRIKEYFEEYAAPAFECF